MYMYMRRVSRPDYWLCDGSDAIARLRLESYFNVCVKERVKLVSYIYKELRTTYF